MYHQASFKSQSGRAHSIFLIFFCAEDHLIALLTFGINWFSYLSSKMDANLFQKIFISLVPIFIYLALKKRKLTMPTLI